MAEKEHKSVSLSEVHRTVKIPRNVGLFRRLLAFTGPAYLVSVGYMDPGNWATDLEGGARFGYTLIWVLLMSNVMAVLLQTLSARLGIVTGRDLAQACRENYPKSVGIILWIMGEIAIAACDLAEVLGTAIGLNLLFHIPLLYGVILTGLDTMLFIAIQHFGVRKMEAFVLSLVTLIGGCFAIEVFFSKPVWQDVAAGFIPHLSQENLYIAIGILGATVMPHNLYLHSALVQTRQVEQTSEGKRQACWWNFVDTSLALNAAFLVNAAILIVAASVFFRNGVVVTEIQQAHGLLAPLLGTTLASTLFAVALISSGQSSTITGTLAGQIVMEGFVRFRIRPVFRRILTRAIAIVPAILVIALKGDSGSYGLLILSQVVLSLQLPFATVPLIKFTSDPEKMGEFANKMWVKILAWITAGIIVVLNAKLILDTVNGWVATAGPWAVWIWVTVVPVLVFLTLLLVYIAVPRSWLRKKKIVQAPVPKVEITHQRYERIGVAVDYSAIDVKVLSHAGGLARQNGATLCLFHIVEGVGGQLFGKEAYDVEAREDLEIIENLANQLRATGISVQAALGYGRVTEQIVRLAIDHNVDLLVMGSHGHQGWQDFVFGTSISRVRHKLSVPVLVVR
jgi:manganese transport protein